MVMNAETKARYDSSDTSPTVCRCDGAPRPLEATGVHCAECRRMFSAGVRLWFARRERRARLFTFPTFARWFDGLAAQLRLQRLTH